MKGQKLTGSAGFAFSNGDESGSTAGSPLGTLDFDCGFTEPSLTLLLPGQEVPSDIPDTMSRLSISSANIVAGCGRASSFVRGWTTARTLNSDVPYLLSRSPKKSVASSHPG
jgi:hypothetical protein